ncbi:MAG: glycoside hydrolase family 3 protein, partial [Spirochaetaceae bacterium]|nr:glycoside hydrolase family 3 protein [Spirochaetaceae bacterium]
MTRWRASAFAKGVLAGVFAAASAAAFSLSFNDALPPDTLARQIVAAMRDDEALAQVFMFGWKEWERGPEPNITDWITQRALGGVKVFGWNT